MILELVERIFRLLMRTCLRYLEIHLLFLRSHSPSWIIFFCHGSTIKGTCIIISENYEAGN